MVRFRKTEIRTVVARGWEAERNGEMLFNRYRVSVWGDAKVLWLYNNVNVLNATEPYTLK